VADQEIIDFFLQIAQARGDTLDAVNETSRHLS
jgi:hypothetical protein